MSLKKIKPKESAFQYDPHTQELRLVSELAFGLNKQRMEFDLDQNQGGDSNYTPITDVKVNPDFSELIVQAVYRKKETTFQFTSTYACDKIIYKLLTQIKQSDYSINNQDLDKLQLTFKEGILTRMNCFKQRDTAIVDSIALLFEDGVYYFIKQKPWKKIKLSKVSLDGSSIAGNSEEGVIVYELDVQHYVRENIRLFFENCLGV